MDKKMNNILFNTGSKRFLYMHLLEESGLIDKEKRLYNGLSKLLVDIFRKYIIPQEELELFDKSTRIAQFESYITINCYDKLGLVPDNISNYHMFPNEVLQLSAEEQVKYPPEDYNTYRHISIPYRFRIPENKIPCVFDNKKIRKYDTFKSDFLDIVDSNVIDALKINLIDYFRAIFMKENFLIEYCERLDTNNFLTKIRNYKQLYDYNKDWYDIVYDKFYKEQVVENNKEFNEDDIELSLRSLKDLLES